MPYKTAVFRDKKKKKWIAELHEIGANRVTFAKRIWWEAYDSEQAAKRVARIKKAEAVEKAVEEIRKLAEEAKAERDKHGWKVNATKAIIEARHGRGRS